MATTICSLVLGAAISAQAQTVASSGGRVSPEASASATLNQGAENPAALTALLNQLAHEVKTLKLEVCKLQLELQREKIAQLEGELQQAQIDKERMGEREGELKQEIAAVEQHLGQATLPAEERTELEAAKAALLAHGPAKLQAEQQRIAEQEAEVLKRLEQEQQRWQELVEKGKELGIEASESNGGRRPSRPLRRQ
jgi:chromosome segregation ATPase